jgi:hypothetical protein
VATSWQITRVRTVKPQNAAHEHITDVELNNNSSMRYPRATIIADLRNPYGDRYYTYAGGTKADVIVAGCPHCGHSDYITTAPDWTTANNLLSLPRF